MIDIYNAWQVERFPTALFLVMPGIALDITYRNMITATTSEGHLAAFPITCQGVGQWIHSTIPSLAIYCPQEIRCTTQILEQDQSQVWIYDKDPDPEKTAPSDPDMGNTSVIYHVLAHSNLSLHPTHSNSR